VSTLIGIAPPLSGYDFEATRLSAKPKFFIQGERDEICPLKAMLAFYARAAEPKELVVIDGADHLFDGKVSEVADAVEDLLGDWSA
jgi:alpha/beta superfamily hydrolase